jgi:hypothetical protein
MSWSHSDDEWEAGFFRDFDGHGTNIQELTTSVFFGESLHMASSWNKVVRSGFPRKHSKFLIHPVWITNKMPIIFGTSRIATSQTHAPFTCSTGR